jgi:catechol 2,3-dioxygenase-like lactoylglutathione lyase family enzyme
MPTEGSLMGTLQEYWNMTANKLGPAIPQLPSGSIDRTEEFFVGILGFQVVAKYPEYHFLILKRGTAEIHFWQAKDEKLAREIGSESSCYIRVENIVDLYGEFKRSRAPFRYELTKQPWGMNEMQIDDPFGNAIRFGEQYK